MAKNKILIVVDMQNDFVSGVLGSPEAKAIVPNVVEKIKWAKENGYRIIYTMDTHEDDYYLETLEGRYLPVKHCIEKTEGWDLCPEVKELCSVKNYGEHGWVFNNEQECVVQKCGFAVYDWSTVFYLFNQKWDDLEIELTGLCTSICVISNAFALRFVDPEVEIVVDASCCAGATPEKHKAALEVMKSCQMRVINENI